MSHRPRYANVAATLALALAIGGPAVAGAQSLLTGRDVKDDSLTGADIQNDSLTGADIRPGSLGSNVFSSVARANLRGATGPTGPQGATGAQGPAGAGVTATVVKAPDVTNYQDLDPHRHRHRCPPRATTSCSPASPSRDTGASDDNLNCGLFVDGNAFGGGGVAVTAGNSASGTTVGALSLSAPADLTLKCQGNGVTTFDISNVTLRIHNLG